MHTGQLHNNVSGHPTIFTVTVADLEDLRRSTILTTPNMTTFGAGHNLSPDLHDTPDNFTTTCLDVPVRNHNLFRFSDCVRLCLILTKHFDDGSTFEPEAITEGGVRRTTSVQNAYQSVRFPCCSVWPRLPARTEDLGVLLFRNQQTHYLKFKADSSHAWIISDIVSVMACFAELGIEQRKPLKPVNGTTPLLVGGESLLCRAYCAESADELCALIAAADRDGVKLADYQNTSSPTNWLTLSHILIHWKNGDLYGLEVPETEEMFHTGNRMEAPYCPATFWKLPLLAVRNIDALELLWEHSTLAGTGAFECLCERLGAVCYTRKYRILPTLRGTKRKNR